MNTLRTHTNNLISLLRRASIDKGNTGAFFPDFVAEVMAKYEESPEYAEVGKVAEMKAVAKALKAVKVYPLDENGNPIKPKRGRPKGSRNRKTLEKEAAAVAPVDQAVVTEPAPETVTPTPVAEVVTEA